MMAWLFGSGSSPSLGRKVGGLVPHSPAPEEGRLDEWFPILPAPRKAGEVRLALEVSPYRTNEVLSELLRSVV